MVLLSLEKGRNQINVQNIVHLSSNFGTKINFLEFSMTL